MYQHLSPDINDHLSKFCLDIRHWADLCKAELEVTLEGAGSSTKAEGKGTRHYLSNHVLYRCAAAH